MTPTTRTAAIACVVTLLARSGVSAQGPAPKFDPSRDPAADVRQAVAEATRDHKRIIVDVGGEWCSWCHTLDRFYTTHTDLMALREQGFVWVKVNWSPQNQNTAFLSHYPAIHGYPHLFVLDADGKLLHSQDTAVLEQGSSYSVDKTFAFLKKWAP